MASRYTGSMATKKPRASRKKLRGLKRATSVAGPPRRVGSDSPHATAPPRHGSDANCDCCAPAELPPNTEIERSADVPHETFDEPEEPHIAGLIDLSRDRVAVNRVTVGVLLLFTVVLVLLIGAAV